MTGNLDLGSRIGWEPGSVAQNLAGNLDLGRRIGGEFGSKAHNLAGDLDPGPETCLGTWVWGPRMAENFDLAGNLDPGRRISLEY